MLVVLRILNTLLKLFVCNFCEKNPTHSPVSSNISSTSGNRKTYPMWQLRKPFRLQYLTYIVGLMLSRKSLFHSRNSIPVDRFYPMVTILFSYAAILSANIHLNKAAFETIHEKDNAETKTAGLQLL